MADKDKVVDPLPDSFASEEEADEFWSSHSTMDYLQYLEPVDDVIEIQERVFEIQISEVVFQKLQQEAQASHQSIPKVADQILRDALTIA